MHEACLCHATSNQPSDEFLHYLRSAQQPETTVLADSEHRADRSAVQALSMPEEVLSVPRQVCTVAARKPQNPKWSDKSKDPLRLGIQRSGEDDRPIIGQRDETAVECRIQMGLSLIHI